MKLSFRPMPGLTIITLIMLAILVWLGTWQYHRLQWKTDLLAEIEASVTAEPTSSLSEVAAAIDKGEPIDFRRIQLSAEHVAFEVPFRVFTSENLDVSWRLFSPIKADDIVAYSGFEVIADEIDPPVREAGPVDIAGYVRVVRDQNKPKVKSTPDKNRWFGFNPMPETDDWGDRVQSGVDTRFYIDRVQGAKDANLLPARRPVIRNNHFDYMLTWYGLAIVLLVIYAILHKREGRLKWH